MCQNSPVYKMQNGLAQGRPSTPWFDLPTICSITYPKPQLTLTETWADAWLPALLVAVMVNR